MERSEGPIRIALPNASTAEVNLAAAMAERLNAVVPAGFRVVAVEGFVSLYHEDEWEGSNGLHGLVDRRVNPSAAACARESFAWLLARGAWNILSGVQDGVAETTREPWPKLPQRGMANPGTRTDGRWVYMWFGPDEESEAEAVLALPPIDVDALGASV
ncbi:MAG TPA: hypothetical protein VJO52_10730 [Gemmatimonadaceae bacterium]|nr:hypothetical protein [Gemmatimonadaceae bacterium]